MMNSAKHTIIVSAFVGNWNGAAGISGLPFQIPTFDFSSFDCDADGKRYLPFYDSKLGKTLSKCQVCIQNDSDPIACTRGADRCCAPPADTLDVARLQQETCSDGVNIFIGTARTNKCDICLKESSDPSSCVKMIFGCCSQEDYDRWSYNPSCRTNDLRSKTFTASYDDNRGPRQPSGSSPYYRDFPKSKCGQCLDDALANTTGSPEVCQTISYQGGVRGTAASSCCTTSQFDDWLVANRNDWCESAADKKLFVNSARYDAGIPGRCISCVLSYSKSMNKQCGPKSAAKVSNPCCPRKIGFQGAKEYKKTFAKNLINSY